MNELLQDPAVQAGILPFAVAFVLVLVIRFVGGAGGGSRFAVFGVAIAFLVAYWLLEGQPPFPPVASKQKLAYLAVLAIALGFLLQAFSVGRTAVKSVAALYPLVAVLWLAERKLTAGPDVDFIVKLLVLWLAGVISLWLLEHASQTAELRINEPESKGGLYAPTVLMIAAFTIGIVSLLGAFIGLAQVSIAIGASLGAYMLVNYLMFVAGGRSLAFGAIGTIGIGGTFVAGAYVMALFGGKVNNAALAVLVLVFFADLVARRIRIGSGTGARIIEPIVYGIIVALPALVALALAYMTSNPESGF